MRAAALGHMDIELDRDGIARGTFLKAGIEEPVWPHLSLALWQLYQACQTAKYTGYSQSTVPINSLAR